MPVLRIIIASVICAGLLWLLLGTLLRGIQTGKMRYLDASSVCDRRKRPLFYWFLALLYTALSITITLVWWQSLMS